MAGSKVTLSSVALEAATAREVVVVALEANNLLSLPPLQGITNPGAMILLHPDVVQIP